MSKEECIWWAVLTLAMEKSAAIDASGEEETLVQDMMKAEGVANKARVALRDIYNRDLYSIMLDARERFEFLLGEEEQ